MSLQSCKEFLISEEGFQDGWLNKYDFSQENKDESIKHIIGKINSSIYKVYEIINLSIISGEYIDNVEFGDKINEVKSLVSSIQSSIDIPKEEEEALENVQATEDEFIIPENDIETTIYKEFLSSFAIPLSRSLKEITFMLSRYERKSTLNNSSIILFDAVSIRDAHSEFKIKEDIISLSRILLQNIKLAEIDRDLSVNKKQLGELLLIKQGLDKSENKSPYVSILKDKCNYLIRKVLYRFKQDSTTSYLYAFDYQDKELTIDDVKAGCFSYFDNITKKHYSIDNNDFNNHEIHEIHEKIRLSKNLSCLNYHHLTKVYKDKNKSSTQVKNLVDNYIEKYNQEISSESISKFDIKSYYIMKNYMYNNRFSILIETDSIKIGDIENFLSEIKQIQLETGIKNYFPYFKICNYLDKIIQNHFNNKSIDYDEVEKLIDKFENQLKDAYLNYEWCKDRNFMAFQLTKKECCIIHNELQIPIFLGSSFVLPINFEKAELELKEFSRKLDKYNTLYEVHSNLKNEKDAILNLKIDIEKSEKKSIEILGIFSAIVLFTSGSVQIFSIDGITMKEGLTFMLLFSYCLVLFIFLIWLITRDNMKNITTVHKSFFVGLFLISCVSFWYVVDFSKLYNPSVENIPQNKEEKLLKIPIKQSPEIKAIQ